MNPNSVVAQAAFTFGGNDPYDNDADRSSERNLQDTLARSMRGLLAPGRRRAYCLAGRATVTVRSITTGTRFTYKIKKAEGDKPLWFVSLLTGPENQDDYQYMGVIDPRGFRITGKSRFKVTAPSMLAISWLSRNWEDPRAEVWHEGRCGRCGRTLTVPESIASGIGPVCEGL